MNRTAFPLPVSHARATQLRLPWSTFWLVVALAFVTGLFAGAIGFGLILTNPNPIL